MPPRQLRLHTLRLSALPFFRSLLVPMIAGVTKQVVQLSRQVTGVDTPLWDRVTSLASVQAVIDFTHSTRAMLITVDPAPSRLRLPRSRGLGSAISVATRASMPPAGRRPVFTKRTDVAVPAVSSPGRGNTDVYELRPGRRRYRSPLSPAHRRAVCSQSAG